MSAPAPASRPTGRATTLARLPCLIVALALAAAGLEQAGAESDLPDALMLPGSEQRQVLYAVGDQIYKCAPPVSDGAKRQWQLIGPEAELFLDAAHTQRFGHHFAGPHWEAVDGSLLKGKVRTSVPAPKPGSIPWLLLDVTSAGKPGVLTGVTAIQRVFTEGGKAPEDPCTDAAAPLKVHYEAQYRLLAPAR